MVPASGPLSSPGLGHSGETSRQLLLRLAAAAHLVREARSTSMWPCPPRCATPVSPAHPKRGRTSRPKSTFAALVKNLLKPADVSLLAAPIDWDTVTDLRERQGIDQRGEHGRGQVPPHVCRSFYLRCDRPVKTPKYRCVTWYTGWSQDSDRSKMIPRFLASEMGNNSWWYRNLTSMSFRERRFWGLPTAQHHQLRFCGVDFESICLKPAV